MFYKDDQVKEARREYSGLVRYLQRGPENSLGQLRRLQYNWGEPERAPHKWYNYVWIVYAGDTSYVVTRAAQYIVHCAQFPNFARTADSIL